MTKIMMGYTMQTAISCVCSLFVAKPPSSRIAHLNNLFHRDQVFHDCRRNTIHGADSSAALRASMELTKVSA
jgi:hypothetical protein